MYVVKKYIINFLLIAIFIQSNLFVQSALNNTELNTSHNINYIFNIIDDSNFVSSFYYQPSVFEIKELNNLGAFIAYPLKKESVLALELDGINSNMFSDIEISAKLAHNFDDLFILTISLGYNRIDIKNYSKHDRLTLDFGAKLPISEFLNIGFAIINLNRGYYKFNNYVNQNGILTFSVQPMKNLFIDFNSYLDFGESLDFGFISSYEFDNLLKLKAGFRGNPNIYELGIQVNVWQNNSIGFSWSENDLFGTNMYYFINIEI